MKKKSGIILSALPLLTLGLCFISNSSFANGVNGNEVILVNSMGAQQKTGEIAVIAVGGTRMDSASCTLSSRPTPAGINIIGIVSRKKSPTSATSSVCNVPVQSISRRMNNPYTPDGTGNGSR